MSSIDKTLAERGSRYGEFPEHAFITQGMKDIMQSRPGWGNLADDQKEALDMVAHKIGRIINGDPNYIDSWTDIIGYTRLVEKRLIDEQNVQHTFAPEASGNNRCSIGEKLVGSAASDMLEKKLIQALCEIFGPEVKIHRVE